MPNSNRGWTVLARLNARLAMFEPATMGQNVNKGEMLHIMNDLIKARRNRVLAAGEHLPTVVWQILILAGFVAVAGRLSLRGEQLSDSSGGHWPYFGHDCAGVRPHHRPGLPVSWRGERE